MTLPLWGSLEKSQDSDQTIEQAIVAAIAEHEADPEAHLGEGESLEMHKKEDVIDHPQGSVLADKWTHTELDFTTSFESLSGFFKTTNVGNLYPGVDMEGHGTGFSNRGRLIADGESGNLFFDNTKDNLVQYVFNVAGGTNERYLLMLGNSVGTEANVRAGMGIFITDLSMKFFAGNATGTSYNESSAIALTDFQTYIVRLYSNSISGKVDCYLNGDLIVSLDWPTTPVIFYANAIMSIWNTSSGTDVMQVKSLYFSLTP